MHPPQADYLLNHFVLKQELKEHAEELMDNHLLDRFYSPNPGREI